MNIDIERRTHILNQARKCGIVYVTSLFEGRVMVFPTIEHMEEFVQVVQEEAYEEGLSEGWAQGYEDRADYDILEDECNQGE